ncbi:MAG: ABC transporter permease, partial [Nanoarchaeota archaeon]
SNMLIDSLKNENFAVIKYDQQDACVASVREQVNHACIVFPPDLNVDNNKQSTISFYVDQSKINVVYLVMSTLRESFGEISTDISKELTSQIITTLLKTKSDLDSSDSDLQDIILKSDAILESATTSKSSLLSLVSNTNNNLSATTNIFSGLDDLKNETAALVEEGHDAVEDANLSDSTAEKIDNKFDEIDNAVADSHETLTYETSRITVGLAKILNSVDSIESGSSAVQNASKNLRTKTADASSGIGSIQVTNADNIASPILTEINPIIESDNNLSFLFPSLVVILIMFIGLLLPSTLIIMEKNSMAHFRLFTTPAKPIMFTISTYLTSMILLVFQLIIIFAVSYFFFNIAVVGSFWLTSLSLFMIMSLFVLIGMFIGYLLNTEEMAMLVSISVAMLFLLTSGIVFPIESMPQYILKIVNFNPIILGSEIFKKSLFFDTGFDSVKLQLGYMLIFSVLLSLTIFLTEKLQNTNISNKKVKKQLLMAHFDFGGKKAKTLPEFIVAIQNLDDEKFHDLLEEDAYAKWIFYVKKDKNLTKKIKGLDNKKAIIDILVAELKNNHK